MPLVLEVTDTAHHQRHIVCISRCDDLVVPDRASRMKRRCGSCFGDHVEPVAEREEGIRRADGAARVEAPVARTHDGDSSRVDPIHLPRPDADHLVPGAQHDGVGLGVLGHAPGEPERLHLGVGAGQMSRVDSARIAAIKAENAGLSLRASVVASDAFFPFRDGVDTVAQAGAKAIVQPGGSVRDDEVIAAADEQGLAMVFTGVRHFRH